MRKRLMSVDILPVLATFKGRVRVIEIRNAEADMEWMTTVANLVDAEVHRCPEEEYSLFFEEEHALLYLEEAEKMIVKPGGEE